MPDPSIRQMAIWSNFIEEAWQGTLPCIGIDLDTKLSRPSLSYLKMIFYAGAVIGAKTAGDRDLYEYIKKLFLRSMETADADQEAEKERA